MNYTAKFTLLAFVSALLSACNTTTVRPVDEGQQNSFAEQNRLLEESREDIRLLIEANGELQEQVSEVRKQVKRLHSSLMAENKPSPRTGAATPAASESKEVKSGKRKKRPTHLGDKVVLGRNEYVWVDALDTLLKARVDTGARRSSISASNVQVFERDGDEWVRFTILHDNVEQQLERPLVRNVNVRQASSEELDNRPVVRLLVRMGDIVEETDFSLADRLDMIYPVLLGRSFLRDIAVVDVARKFTQKKYKKPVKNAQSNVKP